MLVEVDLVDRGRDESGVGRLRGEVVREQLHPRVGRNRKPDGSWPSSLPIL